MEHGVGRDRPADVEALAAQALDCGDDDVDILAAERAILARMRIEAGYRDPRLVDAELSLQSPYGGARLGDDQFGREQVRHVAQRNVDRHRDRLEVGSDEHHGHAVAGDPATLCDELRLPGVRETDRIELGLGDRTGDEARCGAAAGQADSHFQGIERRPRAVQIGTARDDFMSAADSDDRQGMREDPGRLADVSDRFHRPFPDRADRIARADGEEWRQIDGVALLPALGDDLRPDTRRVAKCDREGRGRAHLNDNRPPRRGEGRADSAGHGD